MNAFTKYYHRVEHHDCWVTKKKIYIYIYLTGPDITIHDDIKMYYLYILTQCEYMQHTLWK